MQQSNFRTLNCLKILHTLYTYLGLHLVYTRKIYIQDTYKIHYTRMKQDIAFFFVLQFFKKI